MLNKWHNIKERKNKEGTLLYFLSPSKGRLTIEEVTTQIYKFMNEEPHAKYKVVIGTDSQTTNKSTIFVSALIIQRIGKGAQFYYNKNTHKPMKQLQQRIYKETELSLELVDYLKKKGIINMLSDWPLEIHIDIGQYGETRQLIQEVVGWVTSIGFTVKIKPDSYGASSVADKYTS